MLGTKGDPAGVSIRGEDDGEATGELAGGSDGAPTGVEIGGKIGGEIGGEAGGGKTGGFGVIDTKSGDKGRTFVKKSISDIMV